MTVERAIPSLRWTSWLKWFGVTLLGLLAGLVVFFVIGVTMGEYLDETFPEFVFGLMLGIIFGTAFGLAHWLFLRRHIPGIGAWIPATIIAFAFAAAIIFGLLNPEGSEASFPLRILHATVVGSSLGVAQWLVLRASLPYPTSPWIVFSIGAWITGELAGMALQNLQIEEPLPLMAIFLVGASLSGIGMIWLLRQASRPETGAFPAGSSSWPAS